MNPGIFYLYEYKNNQKYRNVGFLKLIRHYATCTLQLHARGIPVTRNDTLRLSAFYMEQETAHATTLTDIPCDNHAASARLNIAESQFPAQHTLNDIHGFILQLPNGGILAVTIPGITLDPQKIVYNTQKNDTPDSTSDTSHSEVTHTPGSAVMPRVPTPDLSGPAASAPATRPEAESMDSCEPATHREDESPDSCEPATHPEAESPDSCEPATHLEAESMDSCEPATHLEAESSDSCESNAPSEEQIRKIQRSEMSVLPRRYWNLANNSFLLHGYNNYNHLLLIEKDGHYWLGVPGIYDTREARAAELFGFPQFTNSYNKKLDLSKDECSEHGDFGYWCRYLK